jgi:hypothetical protein
VDFTEQEIFEAIGRLYMANNKLTTYAAQLQEALSESQRKADEGIAASGSDGEPAE